jgi:Pyridoxamine 5'-phosphate oxidase
MINYARERAIEVLKTADTVVLATVGLNGVQASKFLFEAVELDLYLLVPRTSDHLFNLEHDDRVALHTEQWELTGKGRVLSSEEEWPQISMLPKTGTAYYILIKVVPSQIQVLRPEGWGPAETIDLMP